MQKYKERVERLPQTDRLIQFAEAVTCREYTLPRDEKSTDPNGWIRVNT